MSGCSCRCIIEARTTLPSSYWMFLPHPSLIDHFASDRSVALTLNYTFYKSITKKFISVWLHQETMSLMCNTNACDCFFVTLKSVLYKCSISLTDSRTQTCFFVTLISVFYKFSISLTDSQTKTCFFVTLKSVFYKFSISLTDSRTQTCFFCDS